MMISPDCAGYVITHLRQISREASHYNESTTNTLKQNISLRSLFFELVLKGLADI